MATAAFRSILAPVDFGELSAEALRYASALAQCGGARLEAMYANAFTPPPYFTESRLADFERQFRDSFAEARAALQSFVDETLGAGAGGVAATVVEGLPVDAIQKVSAELKPDLIVMGTHGRSGVNRLLLGSVTERLLRESRVPVLTVRHGTRAAAQAPLIRSILCPVNNSPVARNSLAKAAEIAACFGATVTALHVKERRGADAIPDLCAWLAEQDRPKCAVQEEIREGEAATQILSTAAEMPCDLLVLGAQHKRFFDSTVLGTTTVRVVRNARCPVLTLPASPAGSAAESGAAAAR